MIFHENRLPADDYRESSASRRLSRTIMPYLLFLKKRQKFNCRLLQIVDGALRVKKIIRRPQTHEKLPSMQELIFYMCLVNCRYSIVTICGREKIMVTFYSGDFCRLLITFANSLDSDQARQNVGPDLDPNCLTL